MRLRQRDIAAPGLMGWSGYGCLGRRIPHLPVLASVVIYEDAYRPAHSVSTEDSTTDLTVLPELVMTYVGVDTVPCGVMRELSPMLIL